MVKGFRTVIAVAGLVASLSLALFAAPAWAAGAGPEDPLPATGQWTNLPAGGQAWYAFNYAGDGSEILVRLASGANVALGVLTPDGLQQWLRGDGYNPIGRGTVNDFYGGDQVWAGNFNTPGTYFVVVEASDTAADYSLNVTGSGVTPTASASAETPAKAETTATIGENAAAATTAQAAETQGKSAADALTPDGTWRNIAPDEQVWYAFQYGGANAPVTIRMTVDPNNPAGFAVWTAEGLQAAAGDSSVQPVGRGSADNALGGDLVWQGGFNAGGTYYIVVTGGAAPTGYALSITQ